MAKLYELRHEHDFDVIVLDTPPSRNAVDFLETPTPAARLPRRPRAARVPLPRRPRGARVRALDGDRLRDLRARDRRRHAQRPVDVLPLAVGHPRRLRRAHARRRRAAARPDDDVPDRHLARARAGARGAVPRASGSPRRGMALRRADRQPRPLRRPRRQLGRAGRKRCSRRSSASAWPGAWRATSPTSTCSSSATARRSSSSSQELVEPDPILVPHLDEDVRDLAGLARLAEHLFGCSAAPAQRRVVRACSAERRDDAVDRQRLVEEPWHVAVVVVAIAGSGLSVGR